MEDTHPIYRTVTSIVTGHFREQRGYRVWRTKGTRDWLIVYTIAGKGRFGYHSGEIVTQPGMIVLIRPGALHDYGVEKTLERWEFLWAHFVPRPHCIEWLNWPEEGPGVMKLMLNDPDERRAIVRRFQQAHELATGSRTRRDLFAMNALEEVLLRCDAQNRRQQKSPVDPRVRVAMDHLCRNIAEKITLEGLSLACGLSVSRLAHLFRAQAGVTPQQFLEIQRMNRARQLLEMTSRSIQAIAWDVGYENPFYFSLRFKRHTAKSPRAYRKMKAKTF